MAAPDFEGQGGSDLAEVVSCTMDDLYKHPHTFDLHQLCILEGCKCWNIYADVLVSVCLTLYINLRFMKFD